MTAPLLEIQQVSTIAGTVRPPGSKSYTNRALIAAALAHGHSVLNNVAFCDDSIVMLQAFRSLGLTVRDVPEESLIELDGAGGPAPARKANIDVQNAGTAMRFMTAYLTLGKGEFVVDGAPRMRRRPIAELVASLRRLGAHVESTNGFPPVRINANGLPGGVAEIDASRSSQFLSALLLAAPYARDSVEITLTSQPVSRPYIDMTIALMQDFGVSVERDSYRRFYIRSGQTYRAQQYAVEADASGASYFLAAAAITRGSIRVQGVGRASIQADARFAGILARMGCEVGRHPDSIDLKGAPLNGISIDLSDAPDLVPSLAVVAVFAHGPTRITNVANLRIKESDRLSALATELTRAGVKVKEHPDGIEVSPGTPTGGVFETYDDHRIAMSISLLGLRTKGVRIQNPGCVAKTYPHFFDDLESVSIR